MNYIAYGEFARFIGRFETEEEAEEAIRQVSELTGTKGWIYKYYRTIE